MLSRTKSYLVCANKIAVYVSLAPNTCVMGALRTDNYSLQRTSIVVRVDKTLLVFEGFVQATSPFGKAKVPVNHVTRARFPCRSEPHEQRLESNNGSSDTCSRVGQDMKRAKIGALTWHGPIVTNCYATK